MAQWSIRPVQASDLDFMRQMLFQALSERVAVEGSVDPEEAVRYLEGWGRDGDCGVVACSGSEERVGAVWMRLFSYEEPGAGFVSPFLPEMVGAVIPDCQRQGVGRAMLTELLSLAKSQMCAFVSVAVVRDSAAHNLLQREGFADAGLSDEDEPTLILLSCL